MRTRIIAFLGFSIGGLPVLGDTLSPLFYCRYINYNTVATLCQCFSQNILFSHKASTRLYNAVVVAAGHLCRVAVPAQGGADALDLVGGDGDADAGAADEDAALAFPKYCLELELPVINS